MSYFFFFQAEDGIRDLTVTGVQTCALPIFVREHVAAARHALLEAALGVSPRVEDGGAGLVYVAAAGLTWLHGDPPPVGRRLVSQARGAGFPGRRVPPPGGRPAPPAAPVRAAQR